MWWHKNSPKEPFPTHFVVLSYQDSLIDTRIYVEPVQSKKNLKPLLLIQDQFSAEQNQRNI